MAKRTFKLSVVQVQELKQAYEACTDGAERTRLQAVRLYGTGWAVATIIELTGCTRRSLARWCQTYQQHGCAGLADHRNGGNRALLSPAQRVGIARKLHRYTPQDLFGADHQSAGTGAYWSVADLRRAVKQWTGVEYQDAQSYRTLFHDCGFSYQRTERQYRSRREADVIDFNAQIEKKLMDVAQNAPETIILAEDEAGVYLQATTQAVWAPQGQTPVIKVHPGRELTHFYGTLNLHTGEEVAQISAVMNSGATAQHLQQVLDQYPATPLLLLWDRAPWHRGAAVRELLAANPRLEVLYFPTASPELNPQEHVWKTVRRAISHNHEETKLATLAQRFEQQLNDSTFAYSFLEKYDFERVCARFK